MLICLCQTLLAVLTRSKRHPATAWPQQQRTPTQLDVDTCMNARTPTGQPRWQYIFYFIPVQEVNTLSSQKVKNIIMHKVKVMTD